MRFRVWDRMLAALSGLLIFLLGAALLVLGAGLMPETYLAVLQGPFETWQWVFMACGCCSAAVRTRASSSSVRIWAI